MYLWRICSAAKCLAQYKGPQYVKVQNGLTKDKKKKKNRSDSVHSSEVIPIDVKCKLKVKAILVITQDKVF